VRKQFLSCHILACITATACIVASPHAQPADPLLPHLVQKDRRDALIVDGEPFLILGAQSNNSSAWPAILPKVWHVAGFIGKVAAAGKAVYPIPLLVNGSVRDPLNPGWPPVDVRGTSRVVV